MVRRYRKINLLQATRYRRKISDFITPFLKIINQAEMDFPISEQYRVIKLFPQSIIKGENPQLGFKSHSGSKTYRRIMNELVPASVFIISTIDKQQQVGILFKYITVLHFTDDELRCVKRLFIKTTQCF